MKFLFTILVSFLLTGCFSFLQPPIQTEKSVFVKPSSSMVKNCTATPPPVREEYLTLNSAQKEKALFEYSNALVVDILTCNVQWTELRKWNDAQEKIYPASE